MILAKLMSLRNDENPDEEKPFLDHLDDLRSTVFKLLLTLIIGFGVCFGFRNTLMEWMRAPIDGVWQLQLKKSLYDLPKQVSPETWERATKAATDGQSLSEEQRSHLISTLSQDDPEFAFHVDSVLYWRSALNFSSREARDTYLSTLPGIEDEMRTQLLVMSETYQQTKGAGPDPDADSRKRTVFMQSLHPTEGFMLSFKLSMYAGIAVTLPFLLFFILQFVLPALHKKEKKAVFPALVVGFGLFLTGILFAYFMVLPRVLEFFSTWSGDMGITNEWRIGEYITFATQFVLIFGLAFELPVIVMTLVFIGVLERQVMVKSRSYAIVGIIIAAAVITPTPDALTLLLLAGPMYFLYELCIGLSWFIERKQRKQRQEEEAIEKERIEKLLAEVEKEEKELHENLGISAPAGLLSHDEHDWHDDHHDLEDEDIVHDDHHDLGDEDISPDDPNPEDLEGNGEATDPDKEDSEADR